MKISTLYWSNVSIVGSNYTKHFEQAIVDCRFKELRVTPCDVSGTTTGASCYYGNPTIEEISPYNLKISAQHFSVEHNEKGETMNSKVTPVTL